MAKFADRVLETTTTTGTGAITLAGAITGYRTFTSVFADQDQVFYGLEAVDAGGVPTGDWEVGSGTFTASGTTISRDVILASSNAGAVVTLAAGTKRVFCDAPAFESQRSFNLGRDLQMGTL